MPVLDTCKFKEAAIKTQVSMGRTTFSPLYLYGKNFCRSRASNSAENNLTWPKFELDRDFMPVLDTCKFKEVVIKTQGSITRTTFWEKILSLEG